MPCNCGGGAAGKKVTFIATFPDGTTKVYDSEVAAKVATTRKGGSYTQAK